MLKDREEISKENPLRDHDIFACFQAQNAILSSNYANISDSFSKFSLKTCQKKQGTNKKFSLEQCSTILGTEGTGGTRQQCQSFGSESNVLKNYFSGLKLSV